MTVQRAASLIDALNLANSVRQSLAASIWTSHHGHVHTAQRWLDVGELWVNTHLAQAPGLPHGGRRASGWGIDLAAEAVHTWSRPQTVTSRYV